MPLGRLVTLALLVGVLTACGGGPDVVTLMAPSPDRPPVTCMAKATDLCPLTRPDTPRTAVTFHTQCAEAWQGCHEEVALWRARQNEIDEHGF